MEMKLRKLWPLVGAMCLGLASAAFAHSTTRDSSMMMDSSESSIMMDSSSQSGQGTYQRGTFREITPPAGPRVAHGADVFITADFIWWKACEEGLSFSGDGENNSVITDITLYTTPPKGKIISVGERWAPGVQVGLGINSCYDGWDLYAQYTWLSASQKQSQSTSFMYTTDEDLRVVNGTENTSNWELHFNVIDLSLGRNFYLSQCVTMRPHFGLKGTWQDHNWTSKYFSDNFVIQYTIGGDPSEQLFSGPFEDNRRYKVWGIGVRGGSDFAWHLSKSWSIFGDLALSTLWTNYYKSTKTLDLTDINTTPTNKRGYINIDNDPLYAGKYIAELELGLRWEAWFYDDTYHFAIQAGWEQQTWINWSAFIGLKGPKHNDFSMQGLNVKLRFDF